MKYIYVFLLLSLVAAVYGDLAFKRNVTVDKGNGDWSYRRATAAEWNIGGLASGVYFQSVSAGGTRFNASGDAIWGAAWATAGDVLLHYLAFWHADISLDVGQNFAELDVKEAAGFIGSGFLALVEKNSSGAVVATQSLKHAPFNPTGLKWQITGAGKSPAEDRIQYATFVGEVDTLNPTWNITVTFIISSVVGVLNKGDTSISPKSIETIVEINNWPYADSKNTLSLVLAVATGEGTYDSQRYISGSNGTQVYFQLSKHVQVNGATKDVTLSGFVSTDSDGLITYFKNTTIFGQLNSKYGNKSDVKLVSITFPAGAQYIEYDPSSGAGTPMDEDGSTLSNATALSSTFLFVLICALLALA